jgi:hypothetical protein
MQRSSARIAISIATIAVIALLRFARDDGGAAQRSSVPAPNAPAATASGPTVVESSTRGPVAAAESRGSKSGNAAVLDAWRARRSNVWVEGSGTVEALLPDDREGSRHQKFIVRVDRELTVLVSHNIDLAPRVPVDRGDDVSFRGEYVWNGKGGIVHWTHHDPRGKNGGWIRVGREVYE